MSFHTRVNFKIYDKDGSKLMEESRAPFLGSTRGSYVTTLSYLDETNALLPEVAKGSCYLVCMSIVPLAITST